MTKPHTATRAVAMCSWLFILCAAGVGPARSAEIIVDNADPGFRVLSGVWRESRAGKPWGNDYRFSVTTDGPATAEAEWRPDLPAAGRYEVAVWYVADPFRSPTAPFTVDHVGGSDTVTIDQHTNGGKWVVLGQFEFEAGRSGRVRLTNAAAKRTVVADAVRFRTPEPQTQTAPAPTPGEGMASTPAKSEFRAVWVTRFEWPDPDQVKAKARIDAAMAQLAKHHFNAVIFQVRGQADTFYPSPYEPWSPLIVPTGEDPGWDPLPYMIEAAHSRGLEFHAYINTHVAWHSEDKKPPANPKHVYYRHFNAADPDARDWLVHDADGKPVQYAADNYVWVAPGIPAYQAYIRQQIMHVVTHYAIDGVHFDRIRSPGPEFSHDPLSQVRQKTGSEGNPNGLDFGDWTRDQFTRLLCDLYAQVMEVKPKVKVSATPVGLYRQDRYPNYPPGFHYGYSQCYQDAQAWLAAGALDFIVPQIYWDDGGKLPDFSQILPDWVAHNAGRHVYAGLNAGMPPREILRQVRFTREHGGQGTVVFHLGGFEAKNYFELFAKPTGVYGKPALIPSMPWKENPSEGMIIGTVTDLGRGGPVVDARITRSGSEYVAISSGDGLYAFLKVPPGTYALTYRKQGVPQKQANNVQVTAGQVTRVDTPLGEPVATTEPTSQPVERTTVPATTPATASAPVAGVTETPTEPVAKPPATAGSPAESAPVPAPPPREKASSSRPTPVLGSATQPAPPVPRPSAEVGSRVLRTAFVVLLMAMIAAAAAIIVFRASTRRDQPQ